jgi:cytosine/adenosine deaminase-related metal-dependent hydrolase
MSMGESKGGLPPDTCVQDEDAILADCDRAVGRYHDAKRGSLRRIDLAPCAPFSVSPELLDQTRAMAHERNVLMHTHAAETLDEQNYCLDRYGMRPIQFLHERGWLGERVYLAHCVHLNEDEIKLFAETGTGVAHCPCSNMRLASGIPPVRSMLDAGVKVGLGVDGSSSNDGGNLLAEARQALLLQRVGGDPKALNCSEAFRLATVGSAEVLNREELGRVKPGFAADLAMYYAADIAFAGAIAQDPLGAIMLCHAPRPTHVFVHGRCVVRDGQVVAIDLPKHIAEFNQLVEKHFRRS